MRLFIAINFDDETKARMLDVQDRLRAKGRGRFTTPENLHLTLAFLGEVDEARLPSLKDVMSSLTVPRMELRFSHVGCFRRDSELWWIGAEADPSLMKLQRELISGLKAAGFSPDEKRFRPHITLARDMHIGAADRASSLQAELLPVPFSAAADHISLMLSHRPNGRLTYTELYSHG